MVHVWHHFVVHRKSQKNMETCWSQHCKGNLIDDYIPGFFVPPTECSIRTSCTECSVMMKINGVHRMNVASISMTFENKVLRLCLGSIRFKENERGDRKRTAIRKERRKRWKNKKRGDDDEMREKYRRGEQ